MAQSDDQSFPRAGAWLRKIMENFRAGQDMFSGREIFQIDEYCDQLSGNFQEPELSYLVFVRDMAYHYAGDATKQSLLEGLLKKRSNPDAVKEHLKTLSDDGALQKLKFAVKSNQQKMYQLPYAGPVPKIIDGEGRILDKENRMLRSLQVIPHTGRCNKYGQAQPAQLHPKQDQPTTLSPVNIRDILFDNIHWVKRTHNAVFYISGRYSGCIKPAYIWTALEADDMGNLFLSDELLDKYVPLWRIMLAYQGNLRAFDDGIPPSIAIETVQGGQGDLTALVESMFLEFKEVKEDLKELKAFIASTTEESSEPSHGEGSTNTNGASTEQSCEEECDDEEVNPNSHSKEPLPTNEQTGDDADLDATEEETRDNGTNNGSPDPLPTDEQTANSAERGNTPLSQTHEGNLTENDDAPEEMTPNTAPKTALAVRPGQNKRPNTGSLQPSNKRARSNENRSAGKVKWTSALPKRNRPEAVRL